MGNPIMKGGVPLMRNGVPTECCCSTCQLCVGSTPKSSYTVDFGAGGLTDAGCDYCDQIVGDFILGGLTDGLVECCVVYEDDFVCAFAASCEANKNMYFQLRLCLVDAGGGQLKWRLNANLGLMVEQDPSCTDEFARAVYESAAFDPDECGIVPVTLNRTSQTIVGGVCNGTYPATVTLDET